VVDGDNYLLALIRYVHLNPVKVAGIKSKSGLWDEFRERRGDSGRDIVLSIALSSCGFTLRELGERADTSLDAVSKAASNVNRRMAVDKDLKELYDSSVSKMEETVRK